MTEDFEDLGKAIRDDSKGAEALEDDIAALVKRSQAFKDTLAVTGREKNLFAVFDREVARSVELQEQLKNRRIEIARDPELRKAFENEARLIRNALQQEQTAVGRIVDDGRSRNVASMQQETTLLNAEIRTRGALAVAQEQRTARARIEVFRFTTRQIIFFERTIRDAFKGTASLVAGGLRTIQAGAARIGQVFRRSNNELNDGLQGALLQRETSIGRSFDRQTNLIRTELTRQQRVIERFQAQAATGIAGIATGRSGLGSLLGGGLAFGGGFLLLDKLKQGFEESVNLNESLNKTRQIFGDASKDIEAFSKTSVEALFVTQSAALEAAANFGIFGRAAGLTGDELSGFAITLTSLATDLASFNNTSVQDAATAISAALRGESEPIRKYGVLLNEVVLQTRAMELGIIDAKRTLQPFERVLAANAEILAQTAVAQGDAARTADDFANSSRRAKAAGIETFAAIAANLVPLAEFVTNAAFPSLQLLTRFIRNDVGPALTILREGLIGAAAGLGALVAAKVAAEALQFLALALRAVLTPLGAFVAAVALIGAAINILTKRSPAMRAAIDQVSNAITDAFSFGIEQAARAVQFLSDLISDVLAPLLQDLAQFLANNLRRAIISTFGFIRDTAIPAVREFGGFILNDVIPPLIQFGEILIDRVYKGLLLVRDGAVALFQIVQPYIQPAIDGFAQLGSAIGNAFAEGDLSGILGGLQAVGTGLAQTFANIGQILIDTLRPQLEKALDFVRDFFNGDTGAGDAVKGALLGPFQEAVEAVAFFLGNVVSDPRLIKAAEALVAFAVVTGISIVKGFVRGVASNLDELADMFGEQFQDALEAAIGEINPVNIAKALVVALGGVAIGTALFQSLRRPVDVAGKRIGQSFVTTMAQTMRRGFNSNQFAGAFVGGFERYAVREMERTTRAMEKAQVQAADRLRLLGVQNGRGNVGEAFINLPGMKRAGDDAVKQLEAIERRFGTQATAAGILRGRVTEVFTDIRNVASGVGQAIGGEFRAGFDTAVRSAGGFARNMGRLMLDVGRNIRAAGIGVGQALGGAILSGVGAALAGKQLGQANSAGGTALGLAGIVTSALFAGAAVGGGAQGVLVGGIVASIGLITAAFTRSGEAAREAAALVDEYRGILERFQSVAEAGDDLAKKLESNLLNQDAAVKTLAGRLAGAGVNAEDLIDAFSDRRFSAAENFALFNRELGITQEQIDATGLSLEGVIEALRSGILPGDITTGQVAALREIFAVFDAKNVDINAFRGLFSFFEQEFTGLSGAIGDEGLGALFNPPKGRGGSQEIREMADQTGILAGQAERYVEQLLKAAGVNPRLEAAAAKTAENAKIRVSEIQQAVDELNRQNTEAVQTQIDEVASALGAAKTASEEARTALEQYLTGGYVNSAQAAINELVLSIPNVASTLQQATTLVPGLRDATTEQALASLGADVSAALLQGFGKEFTDAAGARTFLQPFFDVIDQLNATPVETGGITDETAQQMRDTISAKLEDETFNLLLEGILAADQTQIVLQQQLDDLDLKLGVAVEFDEEQIRAAFQEIFGRPLPGAIPPIVDGQVLAGGQQNAVNLAGGGPLAAIPGNVETNNVDIDINVTTSADAIEGAAEIQRRLRAATGAGVGGILS
jgi:gas vesicle protein